jgi:predicted Zn-dependent protease
MQPVAHFIIAIAVAILLSACAAPQVVHKPADGATLPPPESTPEATPDSRPAIARDPAPTDPRSSGSDAALALMGEADRQLVAGNSDEAAATLERALRIDSRDPRLWQRLAVVRLQQNQPAQAEAMAVRSNGLARGDREMMARNWRIIAEARRMVGNAAGAREADARANSLSGEPG